MSEALCVGDALILDRGRGAALSIARVVTVSSAGEAPFLVLAEADGPTDARAVIAFDPRLPDELALLGPSDPEELAVLAARADARAPSSIEARIEGERRALRLAWSRRGRPACAAAEGAPTRAWLPDAEPGAVWLVAAYWSAAGASAFALRVAPARVLAFAGTRLSRDRLEVLPCRPRPPNSGA